MPDLDTKTTVMGFHTMQPRPPPNPNLPTRVFFTELDFLKFCGCGWILIWYEWRNNQQNDPVKP